MRARKWTYEDGINLKFTPESYQNYDDSQNIMEKTSKTGKGDAICTRLIFQAAFPAVKKAVIISNTKAPTFAWLQKWGGNSWGIGSEKKRTSLMDVRFFHGEPWINDHAFFPLIGTQYAYMHTMSRRMVRLLS